MKFVILGGLILLVVAAAYIRLAPSDPARWHLDPTAPGFQPPNRAAAFCPGPDDRYGDAQADLTKILEVADAWPRTTRLAGSLEEGRVTYVTRSKIMGYPDYTTVALRDVNGSPQFCLVAQQRFGREDFGVNADRIGSWVAQAYGLLEKPPMVWTP